MINSGRVGLDVVGGVLRDALRRLLAVEREEVQGGLSLNGSPQAGTAVATQGGASRATDVIRS